LEEYDSAGVDLTANRWFLSLSVTERFDVLEEFLDFVMEARARNGLQPIPEMPAYSK
jgi:hypothetical protein